MINLDFWNSLDRGPYYLLVKTGKTWSIKEEMFITEIAIRHRYAKYWRNDPDSDVGMFCCFYMSRTPNEHCCDGVPYHAEDLFKDYEECVAECERRNRDGHQQKDHSVNVSSIFLNKI